VLERPAKNRTGTTLRSRRASFLGPDGVVSLNGRAQAGSLTTATSWKDRSDAVRRLAIRHAPILCDRLEMWDTRRCVEPVARNRRLEASSKTGRLGGHPSFGGCGKAPQGRRNGRPASSMVAALRTRRDGRGPPLERPTEDGVGVALRGRSSSAPGPRRYRDSSAPRSPLDASPPQPTQSESAPGGALGRRVGVRRYQRRQASRETNRP
jgi:hypothetical protein